MLAITYASKHVWGDDGATLPLAGHIESQHQVLPRLASLVPAHTTTCLTILEQWLLTSPSPWALQQHEASIRTILNVGMDSGT